MTQDQEKQLHLKQFEIMSNIKALLEDYATVISQLTITDKSEIVNRMAQTAQVYYNELINASDIN
jgi:hypothetical protein